MTEYLTIKEWCKKYDWPTKHAWYNLLRNSGRNGIRKCIVQVGGKHSVIFIDEKAFNKWLESHKQG